MSVRAQRVRAAILMLVHLGLIGSWLLSAAVYIATPPAMAAAMGMPDSIRRSLGIAMLAIALLALAGPIARTKAANVIGLALLVLAGIGFFAYDVYRHWIMFSFYHAALALGAGALLVIRARDR